LDQRVFGVLVRRKLEADELPEHGMSVASVHDGSDDEDKGFPWAVKRSVKGFANRVEAHGRHLWGQYWIFRQKIG
jgi:hypothetical protein